MPSRTAARNDAPGSTAGDGGVAMAHTAAIIAMNVATSTAYAHLRPAAAMMIPPTAGPTTIATCTSP